MGPERDILSLRDGMGSGWDGKFFRRHRRRRPPGGGGSKLRSTFLIGMANMAKEDFFHPEYLKHCPGREIVLIVVPLCFGVLAMPWTMQ